MENIKKVIFAVGSGTSRAPMAAAIMKDMTKDQDIEVLARALIVQFPEPMNQKAEAVLISNGLELEDYATCQLSNEDITEGTVIFTMQETQRVRIIEECENANEENTFVLSSFVGDELEILDPYGAPLQSYGLCFELIKRSVEKCLVRLKNETKGE